jgi:hypothetical protein
MNAGDPTVGKVSRECAEPPAPYAIDEMRA